MTMCDFWGLLGKTRQLLPVCSPRSHAQREANSHVVRTLKQSYGKTHGKPLSGPALSGLPPKPVVSEADPPARVTSPGDYGPGWHLDYDFMRCSEQEPSSYVASKFLTS